MAIIRLPTYLISQHASRRRSSFNHEWITNVCRCSHWLVYRDPLLTRWPWNDDDIMLNGTTDNWTLGRYQSSSVRHATLFIWSCLAVTCLVDRHRSHSVARSFVVVTSSARCQLVWSIKLRCHRSRYHQLCRRLPRDCVIVGLCDTSYSYLNFVRSRWAPIWYACWPNDWNYDRFIDNRLLVVSESCMWQLTTVWQRKYDVCFDP
jgi:hypothetical protein